MVTLATAVNTTATTWHLSGALPAGTDYIQVDDELVAVITPAIRESQRDPMTLYCEVERGTAGTVASHAQGATLTTLPNPPLGDTVGHQAITLLGPFRVNFNTVDVTSSNGAVLTTLDAGTLIFAAWSILVTPWDADPDLAVLYISAGGADYATGNWYSAAKMRVGSNAAGGSDANVNANPVLWGYDAGNVTNDGSVAVLDPTASRIVQVVTEGALLAKTGDTAGATAGAADVYALTATAA
jgi:hypothetical protein